MKKRVLIVLASLCFVASAVHATGTNPGQQAKTFHESIVSRYDAQKHTEASKLIEEFLKKFPSNENVPICLLRLADCYAKTNQWDKYDIPLDDCIKRFPGTRPWFFAWACKLNRARELKNTGQFLDVAEAMIKQYGDVPAALELRFIHPEGSPMELSDALKYGLLPQMFRWPMAAKSLGLYEDWWVELIGMCQTPEQAARALKIIQKLLSRKPPEIPLEWQLAHVVLLDRVGDREKAEQVLQSYVELLEKSYRDYRVIAMLERRAKFARELKDEKTVEACFQRLLKDYPTCRGLAGPLFERVIELAHANRYVEFVPLARQYLKSFPSAGGYRWMAVVDEWMTLAASSAAQKNLQPATEALALIEDLEKGKAPYVPEPVSLHWKYRLLVLLGRYPEAAKQAERIVSDPHWSASSFGMLEADSGRHEAIKAVVDEARKKRGIPAKDPASPAAALLAKLDGHLKEGQERMAEEVAAEMWGKYKTDAHTIEAVAAMADYYFQKVMSEPRDKWANRMIEAYPQHPLTERVLVNQVAGEQARQDYQRTAAVMDLLISRFPGSSGSWFDPRENQRVVLFLTMHDQAGAANWLRQYYGKRIEAGDTTALTRLYHYLSDVIVKCNNKEAGDEWMAMARRLAGTPSEIYCQSQAYSYYYERAFWTPADIQWDAAIASVRTLRSQAIDPEVSWQMQFAEANILARKGEAIALAKELSEQIKSGKHRELWLRLDVETVGVGLSKLSKPEDGEALARRIGAVCVTPSDRSAISLLQGWMWYQLQRYPQASPHFSAIVYGSADPATMYRAFGLATVSLSPQQYTAEVKRFMKAAPNAQDVLPTVLYNWYHQVPESRAVAYKTLVDKYPASSFRDTIENEIAEAQKPKPPPK